RGRRAVSDVAVRAAAVEALGNAASIIPLLQAGGAGARGHAGTGGGAGHRWGRGEGGGEKEEVELRRQRAGRCGPPCEGSFYESAGGMVGEMYRLREVGEGDVGMEGVQQRRVSHMACQALPCQTHDASSQQQRYIGMREWCRAVAGRVVGVLMKQAGEKIDGTREVAGRGCSGCCGEGSTVQCSWGCERQERKHGQERQLRHVELVAARWGHQVEARREGWGGSVRQCVGGRAEGSGVCRDVDGSSHSDPPLVLRIHLHHFPSLPPLPSTPRISRLSFHAAPLLLLPAYRLPLLSGLLLSAGALSHSLTAASLRALLSLKQELGAQGGTREAGEGAYSATTPWRLYPGAGGGIGGGAVPPTAHGIGAQVLGAVDLLCHLAAPLCSARCHALSTLLWLIAVRFPTSPLVHLIVPFACSGSIAPTTRIGRVLPLRSTA
ncbi:unnamed protein product, partial [Closterium sp. NIES-64]